MFLFCFVFSWNFFCLGVLSYLSTVFIRKPDVRFSDVYCTEGDARISKLFYLRFWVFSNEKEEKTVIAELGESQL